MIRFKCPHCDKAISVGEKNAGRKGQCHGCGKTIQVPEAKQPEPKIPEPKQSESQQPKPKQPEPKKPEPKQPEAKQPIPEETAKPLTASILESEQENYKPPQLLRPSGSPFVPTNPSNAPPIPATSFGAPAQVHVHVAQYQTIQQQQFLQQQPKSVGVALLLTFLFGPFGMFYSTVTGAVVMLIISISLAVCTFGISLFITWPICMAWAAFAAAESYKN